MVDLCVALINPFLFELFGRYVYNVDRGNRRLFCLSTPYTGVKTSGYAFKLLSFLIVMIEPASYDNVAS